MINLVYTLLAGYLVFLGFCLLEKQTGEFLGGMFDMVNKESSNMDAGGLVIMLLGIVFLNEFPLWFGWIHVIVGLVWTFIMAWRDYRE